MTWIIITILSYFLGALTVILDKYLLSSERVSAPPIYTFYVGLLGLGVLIFWPLGFLFPAFVLHFPSWQQFILSFVCGIFFLFGILALYFAIKKSEASKVTPVTYSVVPIVTLIAAFAWEIENFSSLRMFGVMLLILGGLLISFDLPLKINKKKFFAGFYLSVVAGLLIGMSTFLLKLVYDKQNFFNGYVWTRFGAFLGIFALFLIPSWKKQIIQSFKSEKNEKRKKENLSTGVLFVSNKILGGSSSALINLAIGLGSVTIVSSLVSIQYIFVLLMAIFASSKIPHIFEERLYFWDWMQKIIAIFIIGFGMYLIS